MATADEQVVAPPGASGRERAFWRQLLRTRRAQVGAISLWLLAESLLALAMPWLLARFAGALLAGQAFANWLALLIVLVSAQALVAVASRRQLGRLGAVSNAELGTRVYDHLQALPVSWHQQRRRGEVLALLGQDVWRIGAFLTGALVPLAPLLLTCAGALLLLLRIEPRLGLVIALAVPLFTVVIRLLSREIRPLTRAWLDQDAARHGIAEQNLAALPLIKAFAREPLESGRFATQTGKVLDLELRQLRAESLLAPVVRWLGAAGVLSLLWFGGTLVAAGTLAAADLLALLLYGLLLVNPVAQLAGTWGQWQQARGAAQRLAGVLATAPEPDDGRRELPQVRGDIAFERVAFAYPGREAVFAALDWSLHAGETVAITGANGAGKSTLAHLLLRFADPSAGRITLDGVDLRELRLANLRAHIGLVGQHVLLLNATVAENIGYGRLGASRADIERAARAAHAHPFIERLPQGYDTRIGDEGLRLSGGQRQRLSLARALLKDPAILVLDEATAMFDPEGERGFIAECHGLLKERTVILITHRPASLALADRVFVLADGVMRETAQQPVPP